MLARSLAYLLTCLLTYSLTYLLARSLTYLLTYAHRSRWSIGHLPPLAIALCSGLLWSFQSSWSPAVSALLQCLASNCCEAGLSFSSPAGSRSGLGVWCILRVCQIQPHFPRSICLATGSCPARSQKSVQLGLINESCFYRQEEPLHDGGLSDLHGRHCQMLNSTGKALELVPLISPHRLCRCV